jgi:hypothetical protein
VVSIQDVPNIHTHIIIEFRIVIFSAGVNKCASKLLELGLGLILTRSAEIWGDCCQACTDSSDDTVENFWSPWLLLIMLLGCRLVKLPTFMEAHKIERGYKPEAE